jgi:hypothetical protein
MMTNRIDGDQANRLKLEESFHIFKGQFDAWPILLVYCEMIIVLLDFLIAFGYQLRHALDCKKIAFKDIYRSKVFS